MTGDTATWASHHNTDDGDYGRKKVLHSGGKAFHRSMKMGSG